MTLTINIESPVARNARRRMARMIERRNEFLANQDNIILSAKRWDCIEVSCDPTMDESDQVHAAHRIARDLMLAACAVFRYRVER